VWCESKLDLIEQLAEQRLTNNALDAVLYTTRVLDVVKGINEQPDFHKE
jgi:hypothetical protein